MIPVAEAHPSTSVATVGGSRCYGGEAFSLLNRGNKPPLAISASTVPTVSPTRCYGGPFSLPNRRYIGNKHKLNDWIFSAIRQECRGSTFADIFAGTGAVSAHAMQHFSKVITNDFLHSNYAIYRAFFGKGRWNKNKIGDMIAEFNAIDGDSCPPNYFSDNFGGKYFSDRSARIIGHIRGEIERRESLLSRKEFYILVASLLYSADKIANTVGHYDAYFKKSRVHDAFVMRSIAPVDAKTGDISIFRDDANLLAKKISADVVYIDPPYNSRQYSRFYHVLETLTKWDQPRLYGVALKPNAENMSEYCRVGAKQAFARLVADIRAKYLAVSYNNTYAPKSNSSRNKITLSDIKQILNAKGKTKTQSCEYRHFNAGNTDLPGHREFLFITQC